MIQGIELTKEQLTRFITHLRASANVTASARAIGASRRTLYNWRDRDEQFAAEWADALEEATDALEAEARRRAVEGVEEYVTCKDGLVRDEKGNPVMQRRYSDGLLIRQLQAYRPERYRDRATVDVNNTGNLAELIEAGRKRARDGSS